MKKQKISEEKIIEIDKIHVIDTINACFWLL